MSRLACVWADLADDTDAESFYEDTHVPKVVAKFGSTARNAEVAADNIFKEVSNIEGKYLTLYDVPKSTTLADIDAQIQLDPLKIPKDTKFEARIYDEYAAWLGEEWPGHHRDVQMCIIVLWQPVAAVHGEFVEWMQTDFVPGMLESPELLRARIFKLQHASVYEEGKAKDKDIGNMYQYMTVWEFDCEDLPWEIMVYLGSSEGWRHYVEGGYLQWQMTQYLMSRVYPEDDENNSHVAKRASILVNGSRKGSDVEKDEESSETP